MPRLPPRVEARVDAIPNDGEWWRQAGRQSFLSLAEQLLRHGLTEDAAVSVLQRAYDAVAGEFGN
jgi:hypothetical protein